MFKTFSLKRMDYLLIFAVLMLNLIGIFAIGSAAPALRNRQIFGTLLGIAAMLLCASLDYSQLLKGYILYYLLTLGLLFLVLQIGSTGGGAQRWFTIGGLTFQPSEAAKLLLILFYAAFIMKQKEHMKSVLQIAACILLILPPLYMVYRQPDLSTTIVIFLIFCGMLFVGGLPIRLVVIAASVALPAVVVFFFVVLQEGQTLLSEYQQGRILAWLFPENYPDLTFQTLNSITAIGSGQLTGKGYNNNEISSVLNSGFISQSQTDFIYTVISEEFGFLGSVTVLVLLLLITVKCLLNARRAKDTAGMIIATGVGCWVGFQGFLNIGVVTGVLPNTGLPLPFVSYGLTSLLSLYAGIGFVLNVHMQSPTVRTVRTVDRIRRPL